MYEFSLIIPSILIWTLMVFVRYTEYEANVYYFSLAALISLLVTLFIIFALIFKRQLVKNSALVTVIFLITSSPLSLYFFLEYIWYIADFLKLS